MGKKTFTVGASALTKYQLCKTPSAAVVTAAVTDEPFGVIQDGASATGTALFITSGKTKAVASAAIAIGAELMPGASGRVTTHDNDAASVKIGQALQAASAAGDIIEIDLAVVKSIADA
jgi:hypothetical protein